MTSVPIGFAPVLDALVARLQQHGFAPSVRLVPLRHEERPFSTLLELRATSPARQADLFVKIVRARKPGDEAVARARLAREAHVTAVLAAYFGAADNLGAVRTFACFPKHLAIVTERAVGVSLLTDITRRSRWRTEAPAALVETLRNVGAWLPAFQAALPTDGRESLDELREYVDVRMRRLLAENAIGQCDRAQVLAAFDTLSSQVDAADLGRVTVHADFTSSNVLVDGPHVTVLDFAMTRAGNRYHDLSHLHLQLELMTLKPWFRRSAIAHLQQALLEGFSQHVRADHPLFALSRLVHHVNHFTALVVQPAAFASRPYNWRQKRWHRKQLKSIASSQ